MHKDESNDRPSDRELLHGFTEGDRDVVEDLMNKCLAVAAAVVGKGSPRSQEWEDTVRDIAMGIMESLEDFELRCSLNTWIWQVGLRKYADWVRQEVRRPMLVPLSEHSDEEQPTVDETVAEAQRRELLARSLMQMPEPYRMALSLYHLQDYSHREIAQFLDQPEGTIKWRVSRGRELLREMLDEDWDWE